jgi:DNA-binding HxlR family transcriptional regulator
MVVAMKGYGQFCPVAKAAEILAERWTPLVLRELTCGSTRFNDLRRGVPLMSSSLLSQRLKFLEQEGVIERRRARSGRGYEYHLTDAGQELQPLIRTMGEWGQRWVRSRFGPEDLDVALLMWDMKRSVRPENFPRRRIVVAFEFTEAPPNKSHWWLVSEQTEVDLCLNDPHGPTDLRRRLTAWLGLSAFAPIKNMRPAPARGGGRAVPQEVAGKADMLSNQRRGMGE